MMRVSVTGDLRAVLRRFRPRGNAQMRVEMSRSGLDIIGNAEGYLTLARWCLVMAHPEMQQVHPRWLYSLLRFSDAFTSDFVSIAFKDDDADRELPLRDVRFFRVGSDGSGADAQFRCAPDDRIKADAGM